MFVTGGVGGVHRGGERSLDVSADLAELGRAGTPVVSAGVKSILDIGRTLEFLVRTKMKQPPGKICNFVPSSTILY